MLYTLALFEYNHNFVIISTDIFQITSIEISKRHFALITIHPSLGRRYLYVCNIDIVS